MGTAFLYGNGGGIDNLKFRVYSATSLPSSGKENDVCIITSTPISSWEAGSVDNPAWSMDAGFVYLTCDASDASQPNLLRKNALYLKLMRCCQYEKGTWSTKDAYQYRGGAWVQFSSNFSATINVTYPAGSICTATDGVTTIAAPDTSGTWACVVPNAGTWTVKVKTTDGEKEKTSDVVITNSGQIESITIVYQQILYYQGDEYTDITGGWIGSTTPNGVGSSSVMKAYAPSINKTSSAIIATVPTHPTYCYTGAIRTQGKVRISGYSTLHMEVKISASNSSAENETFYLFADPTGSSAFSPSNCACTFYGWTYGIATKQLTLECDISNANADSYVGLYYYFIHDFGLTATITKVWID